jgi:hypothetical protein
MRKSFFNYSFYSHPEIGNFRVWHDAGWCSVVRSRARVLLPSLGRVGARLLPVHGLLAAQLAGDASCCSPQPGHARTTPTSTALGVVGREATELASGVAIAPRGIPATRGTPGGGYDRQEACFCPYGNLQMYVSCVSNVSGRCRGCCKVDQDVVMLQIFHVCVASD